MSIIDRTKSSLNDLKKKVSGRWQSFKDSVNEKTLSIGDYLTKNYNWIEEELSERYSSLQNRYRVRKFRAKKKAKRKWDRKWSHYVNYFVWTFTPYVLVYGLAVNFVLSQIGLLSLSLGHLAASGIGTYFVKEEFPEWMNRIEWLHKDGSSEV